MSSTACVPNARKQEALALEFPPGNAYKMALYTIAAAFNQSSTVYSATGEIPATGNYTTGGKALAGYAAALNGNVACITWTTPVWASATISNARYGVIYDTTNGNKIASILDFGADISSTNADFTVTLPLAAAGGIIQNS